jgi:hypothetical protein
MRLRSCLSWTQLRSHRAEKASILSESQPEETRTITVGGATLQESFPSDSNPVTEPTKTEPQSSDCTVAEVPATNTRVTEESVPAFLDRTDSANEKAVPKLQPRIMPNRVIRMLHPTRRAISQRNLTCQGCIKLYQSGTSPTQSPGSLFK